MTFDLEMIQGLYAQIAKKVDPIYEIIRQRVQGSKVVGTDETGARVNGERHWFWTWQTPKYTFIAHSDNRGSDTVRSFFPSGFPKSTLVHDAWKPQIREGANLDS